MSITLQAVAAMLAVINGVAAISGLYTHRRIKRLESAVAAHAATISTQSGMIATLQSRLSSKGL